MGFNIKNITNTLKTGLKRKEGGTMVGNLLRVGASAATSGLLGNGVMMLKPGESVAENNEQVKQSVIDGLYNGAAGAIAGNKLAGGKKIDDPSVIGKLKKYGLWIGVGFLALIFGIVSFVKSKNKSKNKKR